jgi:hypothetical protein
MNVSLGALLLPDRSAELELLAMTETGRAERRSQ